MNAVNGVDDVTVVNSINTVSPVTPSRRSGFTLIEVLVVLAIMGVLMSLAVPRYYRGVERSKETVLRQNLFQVRESIDKYFADTGRYPAKLEELVEKRYLRAPPLDPITESATTWIVVPPRDPAQTGVYDIHSGAKGQGLDGSAYGVW